MKILATLFLVMVLAGLSSTWLASPVFDEELNQSAWDSVAVAPLDEAITLAMSTEGDVLLVLGADADAISAINLSEAEATSFPDAVAAYSAIGDSGLRDLANGPVELFTWAQLGVPVSPTYPSIAAGTNFVAHAEEVGLEEKPFLFPKLSWPTPWNSSVQNGGRLDYEVELCAVLLEEHSSGSAARLGYLLCGDYTDRWTLVRDIDLDGVMGQTGFALAKGGDSRFPVGALLAIPVDADFYREIEISLYLNGELRQRSYAEKMVWSPLEVLDAALADCSTPYEAGEDTVHITDCEVIPPGTLVLTGTPAGVMFNIATLWNPWSYLRPGDEVVSFASDLGYMVNQIRAE